MRIRIEAQIGPVVLVYDRDGHPQFGESFRVAVFVADKAMGTAKVTNEQFTAFCQAAPMMRSGSTP